MPKLNKPKKSQKTELTASAKDALPEIVKRYAAGESIQAIAKDIGQARSTLYKWMLGGMPDEKHTELVTDCLINRISNADGELETADNAIDIARAREAARFARMDLERRRPALYGQKQSLQVNVTSDLGTRLRDARSRIKAIYTPAVIENATGVADVPAHIDANTG